MREITSEPRLGPEDLITPRSLELATPESPRSLRGSFRLLFLYDVAEGIQLGSVRELLGAQGDVPPSFGRRTPQYIRFEEPPYIERSSPRKLPSGEVAACSIKYYAFAVVAVELEIPFDCDWRCLIREAARWNTPTELETEIRQTVRARLERIAPAVTRPHRDWLYETYLVVHIEQVLDSTGSLLTAESILASHSPEIASIVSGEESPLSPSEIEEILRDSLSYYAHDLILVSATGALVYDRTEEAAAAVQILEYAKMQLLEFRYYDRVMSRALGELYDALERKRSLLISRWTVPRDADRINRIRLDVSELTERLDNEVKFVSDAYYARVHRLAAGSMGVEEYRQLVDEKLATAGELYDSLIDRFNEARSFVLELAVAVLVLLDVLLLLRYH